MKRLSLWGALALSGCMVGPDYHQPALSLPAAYKTAPGWVVAKPADSMPKGAWWRAFNDPVLNQLEPQVAVNNATLKADYYAYQQAVQMVQATRGGLFPGFGLSSNVTRQSGSGGNGLGVGPRTSGTFEGSASWSVDLWGKIRRQVESDVAAAQVSAADLANATLSAQAQLAADYVDLRAADAAITLYQQTVAAYQRSLQIVQNQLAAGTAAPSDLITARTALEGAQAALINAGAARAQYEHAIAVLTGRAPAELAIPAGAQIASVPLTPPGVPSTLLQRRPDIAAAERMMAEQNALIGMQIGAYYPDITLSALGGYAANPITGLFTTSSALWSLGADFSETVFAGGSRSANVQAARYAYRQSVETYRQTVLNAFQGVENDLSNLTIYAQQAAVQDQAVRDAARAVQIALNEYQAGTQAYTTVVQAQVTLLQDQQTQLAIQQNRLLASVALFQDLGGGFSAADLPSAAQIQTRLPFAP